jgi:DNA-directed RNA polymerase subunit RPC12/RpoP
MTDYRCLECGEEFEYRHHCVLHSNEWKHEKFEIIATDMEVSIKV